MKKKEKKKEVYKYIVVIDNEEYEYYGAKQLHELELLGYELKRSQLISKYKDEYYPVSYVVVDGGQVIGKVLKAGKVVI